MKTASPTNGKPPSFDPTDSQRIEISSPKDWAAGIPAVISAYKNVTSKAGPFKGTRLLSDLNQIEGFDCPGCAWPDPLNKRATFEFCENGAKAVADEATTKRADAQFFAKHSIAQLCEKSDRWLNDQGRLVEPMWLAEGAEYYQPIDWDSAFAIIAKQLNVLDSPNQAAFYTSGRTGNEAAFLYQLFVRKFGTNNLPDCSNMCHESSGVGLGETIGVGKGTVSLEDLEHAEAIFVFGQNPGTNHPRMLGTLQDAKRNGAKIVAINPLDETGLKRFKNPQEVSGVIGNGTALRDLYLPVKINGDVALLKGLCKVLIERDNKHQPVLDHEFIEQYCHGFEEFKADIEQTSWQDIVKGSGLSQALIEQAADIACESKKTICCWAMGMTQHKNAVANIQLMTNFLMLQGNLGKPGAGVCPVRGHSNVQGDRTMGIWEKPRAEFLDALEQEFAFNPPRDNGVDAVETVHGMQQGQIKVLFALGGNFFRAMPDHQANQQGLSQCELTVQVSTKLNRSHLYTGKQALILPALGRTEIDTQNSGIQTITVENSMGVIQTSHGKIPPASDLLKSEVDIIAQLAQQTLKNDSVNWLALRDDYRLIRDHIANVIPGFENFNQRIDELGEFVLPNGVRDARNFVTATGKANFMVHSIDNIDVPEDCLLMMTIRSHDQFNTTVYTNNDRYRGVRGTRKVLFVNKEDIADLGMHSGQKVTIRSHWPNDQASIREVTDFALVEYAIPKGCAAAYYPETNDLIPIGSVADKSNTPAYKSIVISLHAAS
ncbi:FdhF/YdeP family oxidoreductase [Aliiglaciecola sp. 3_MG-2023]|uniref:FdhF/YdeP family oxidoreductase n=1 Tax=Aliiglaciecola sp. 3_MG-2023 TaxID=3062644 RepID=UPI0026E3FC95|nr:FdhF/YdeP family oxidoreductase [Aliiglaciecola sp. 3_MG-2023]MDO6694284.1 FdhF/YdeP family oxidoreductase [Aliiglaciecola sp. 3_MG-2023]